jgi:hypothetical protein
VKTMLGEINTLKDSDNEARKKWITNSKQPKSIINHSDLLI